MSAPEAELPLAVEVQELGGARRVDVAGDLDMETAPLLLGQLSGIEGGRVLVDLTRVAFIDSSGIRVLTDARSALLARGGQLCVHEAPVFVREVFLVAGVDDLLCDDEHR